MRKIVLAVLALFSAFGLTVALAGPAAADGPFNICLHNGNRYCVDSLTVSAGDLIFQYTAARNLTFIDQGVTCPVASGYDACEKFVVEFYNGNVMASTVDCGPNVVIKDFNSGTIGYVWYVQYNNSGVYTEFQNQHCVGSGSFMYGDNNIGDYFQLDGGGAGGHYYKTDIINA